MTMVLVDEKELETLIEKSQKDFGALGALIGISEGLVERNEELNNVIVGLMAELNFYNPCPCCKEPEEPEEPEIVSLTDFL